NLLAEYLAAMPSNQFDTTSPVISSGSCEKSLRWANLELALCRLKMGKGITCQTFELNHSNHFRLTSPAKIDTSFSVGVPLISSNSFPTSLQIPINSSGVGCTDSELDALKWTDWFLNLKRRTRRLMTS